ncbi:MAG: hypothetical protein GEV28_00925 [Actinophytocola sp.]|uniref:hypothetical protein n=1 Tax=Actinophytocola sp. TaxID=1872138 RepID=UPI0013206C69|nr:hypothetical protein [Actinophytocola sp.]MPZ79025.1 hypothetical protein [Actinophytocola sp.]
MRRVLVVCAGGTEPARSAARAIDEEMSGRGLAVDVHDERDLPLLDIYDAVVRVTAGVAAGTAADGCCPRCGCPHPVLAALLPGDTEIRLWAAELADALVASTAHPAKGRR